MKAVVFIDVQNDFIKGGKLAFGCPAEDNLQDVVSFAEKCVKDGNCKLYATRDTHEKTVFEEVGTVLNFNKYGQATSAKRINGNPTAGYLATLEGKKLPVEHCIEGTEGWQVADKLMDVLHGSCTFINKPTFGSYDLIDIVEEDFGEAGPDEIIIAGYDLSICVLANAVLLRAKFPDTKITVVSGLCGDVDKTAFDAAVKVLKMQQIDVVEKIES